MLENIYESNFSSWLKTLNGAAKHYRGVATVPEI